MCTVIGDGAGFDGVEGRGNWSALLNNISLLRIVCSTNFRLLTKHFIELGKSVHFCKMYIYFAIIVLVFAIYAYAATEPCMEDGIWEERNREVDYVTQAVRIYRNDTKDHSLDQQWLRDACPVEALMFSCYYYLGRNDSSSIDYRRWKPNDPNSKCRPYLPAEFLKRMKNKSIVFTGDSLMGQYFFALVCTLTSLTTLTYQLNHMETGNSTASFCHFGNKHCVYLDSTITIPSINATLKLTRMQKSAKSDGGKYYGNDAIWRPLYGFDYSRTAFIFNFGLHINSPAEYSSMLKWFVNDLSYKNHTTRPKMYFLETSPQHYGGQNGYFDGGLASELLKEQKHHGGCAPNDRSDDDMEYLDWRNRLLKEHLNETIQRKYNIRIIELAKDMYSQYDAHIGRVSRWNAMLMDCTHYCFPSGIFDYVIRKIYNKLLNEGFF
jgi:hypothetical protein